MTDIFQHVQFTGTTPRAMPVRWLRQQREAPSPSIFASPFKTHAPVISPSDRLLLEDVFRRMQLNGAAYRPAALGRRVPACLRALQVRSPAEAIRRLEQEAGALDKAMNALLIGVTAFFRDESAFSHLQLTALPDLLRTSPAPRILSVGCSDGAEPYSLAIALLEAGATSFTIRGIDCRRRAIDRAKAGIFPVLALGNMPQEVRLRYFDDAGSTVRVKPELRARLQWQQADAFIHTASPPYDLIACRNFAIYLEHPAAARLWRRLHAWLRPAGLLFAGKAERPTSGFLRAGPCLFRKACP